MSVRKEVFQAKVLQKLYPSHNQLKLEKAFHPPPTTDSESAAKETGVIAKNIKLLKGDGGRSTITGRKLYTVLPPPEGYTGDALLPVVDPELKSTDRGSDQSEEADDVQEELLRRRKRRKGKRKLSEVPADGSEGKESATGSEVSATQTTSAGERLSRNKKRKLKKKRHKERMRSLGLAPQASAVEFTYQPRQDAEEEEDRSDDGEEELHDEQVADLLEFLKTTLQTYISDRTSPERTPPSGAEALLFSLSARTAPPGELARLHCLKDLVLRRHVEELERTLEEFQSSTSMPPAETSAVCTLFHYWITDIFPLGAEVLKT